MKLTIDTINRWSLVGIGLLLMLFFLQVIAQPEGAVKIPKNFDVDPIKGMMADVTVGGVQEEAYAEVLQAFAEAHGFSYNFHDSGPRLGNRFTLKRDNIHFLSSNLGVDSLNSIAFYPNQTTSDPEPIHPIPPKAERDFLMQDLLSRLRQAGITDILVEGTPEHEAAKARAVAAAREWDRQREIKRNLPPFWSADNGQSQEENASIQWKKYKSQFRKIKSPTGYIDAANTFVSNPPAGTLTKPDPDGDTLLYHPGKNWFAIKDAKGLPKTFFKPTRKRDYWDEQ